MITAHIQPTLGSVGTAIGEKHREALYAVQGPLWRPLSRFSVYWPLDVVVRPESVVGIVLCGIVSGRVVW